MTEKPIASEILQKEMENLRARGTGGLGLCDIGRRPLTTGEQMVEAAADKVREHISRQPHVQRLFSFMPTLMTQVSPFHLKSRQSLRQWPLVRLDSGEGAGWGRMQVVGELLVIFDETVLFALLVLMRGHGRAAFESPAEQICQLCGLAPAARNATAIWKSLQRLTGTRIDLDLYAGRNKKRRSVRALSGSILSFAERVPEKNLFRVSINPYFFEMYADSLVADIDLGFRTRLKYDISKALYRFYQGHLKTEHEQSITDLMRAINLDPDEAPERIQRMISTGLSELKSKGYLSGSEISKSGIVRVAKSAQPDLETPPAQIHP